MHERENSMTPKEAVDIYVSSGEKIEDIGMLGESEHFFHFFTKKTIAEGGGIIDPDYVVIKNKKKLSKSIALRFKDDGHTNIIPREEWDAESEPEAQPNA